MQKQNFDKEILCLPFCYLRQNTSKRCFFFTLAEQFYEAFKSVNGCNPKWLWCTWHVDKAWKSEIRSSISDLFIQKKVYQYLRALLEQLDPALFSSEMDIFLEKLKASSSTQKFAVYFQRNWWPASAHWAYWGRKATGINTNMLCEAFHRVFKYSYLNGKFNKRLDACLFSLIKYNQNRIYERLIKLTKGKKSHKINLIDNRHSSSLQLSTKDIEIIGKDLFMYKSEGKSYDIERVNANCSRDVCRLWCNECDFCYHAYKCNCTDFHINNVSCKHIHLVHRKCFEQQGAELYGEDISCVEPTSAAVTTDEIGTLLGMVSHPQQKANTYTLQSKIEKKLQEIMVSVSECSSDDEPHLKLMFQKLNAAKNTFDSVRANPMKPIEQSHKVHANQNIQKQARFVSTKKKRKLPTNMVFVKPTNDEKKDIFNHLQFIKHGN